MQRPDLHRLVVQAAKRHGVPQDLAVRQILQESSGNPRAVSPQGAKGLGQLMPGTARMLGVTNVYDPKQNTDAAMRYMAQLKRQHKTWRRALIAYNWGPSRLSALGEAKIPPETRDYLNKVWKGE